jgi:hypothetical protein
MKDPRDRVLMIGIGISPSPCLNSGAPPGITGGGGTGGGGPSNTTDVIAVNDANDVIQVNSVNDVIQVGA